MFESTTVSPMRRRRVLLSILVACMTLTLLACSEDDDSRESVLGEDSGADAAQDAGVDTATDAEAERDAGAEPDAASDGDANQAEDARDADPSEDAEGDTGVDGADARDDGSQTHSCADGDGRCPTGCYATTDDDCTLDCRDPSTWPPSWVAFEEEAIQLINQERAQGATCGSDYNPPAPAATFNAQLREAARCHSLDMAQNDVYGHEGSDGSTAGERLDDTGYNWRTRTEVVAAKRYTAAEVVAAWMGSPGHCNGLTQSKYHEIGIGYVFEDPDALGYQAYWTGVLATSH